MKTFKDVLEEAISKAASNNHDVFIYDDGHNFEILLDNDGTAGGQLSYIVHPDGTFDLVDG